MHSLADVQAAFAQAITTGDATQFDGTLLARVQPRHRVGIHLRHYEASLTAALCDKFPACAWLVGTGLVRDAARAYVRAHPPAAPCISEYGGGFPQFLGNYGPASSVPYLTPFAVLECAVGQVSIATEHPRRSWIELSQTGPDELMETTLVLQPGLRYLRSTWRIDDLMTIYLSGAEPERFVLGEATTCIEVRGARGTVRLERLDAPTFAFREALAQGRSIGDAAIGALDLDAAFDPGAALRSLGQAGLVAGLSVQSIEAAR